MVISVNMVIIIFCNEPFKAFLESQMSNDKHTPLLPIKKLHVWCGNIQSFFSGQYLFSTSITLSYKFKSSITVFKKKEKHKPYLTKSFFVVRVLYAYHQIIYLKVKKHW